MPFNEIRFGIRRHSIRLLREKPSQLTKMVYSTLRVSPCLATPRALAPRPAARVQARRVVSVRAEKVRAVMFPY